MLGLGGGPVRAGGGGLWVPAHPASAIAADTINAEARADSQAIQRSPRGILLAERRSKRNPQCVCWSVTPSTHHHGEAIKICQHPSMPYPTFPIGRGA